MNPAQLLNQLVEKLGVATPLGAHSSRNDLATVRTLTLESGADGVWLQAITQNVRITITPSATGTAATATLGFQLKAGDPPVLVDVPSGVVVKAIEEAATAVLQQQSVKRGVA